MVVLGPGRLFLQDPIRRVLLGHLPKFVSVTFRSFCLGIEEDKEELFAVSYLINSLGFSKEMAISASRKLKFDNPVGPNAVLDLFRDQGFSESQISKLFKTHPKLLVSDPKETLLPKIEFFYSVGFTRTQVTCLCSIKPSILGASLNKTIIPWYNFLKTVLFSNEKVFIALKHPSWLCHGDVQAILAPNIAFLRQLGVPESLISNLLIRQPRAMVGKPEDFQKSVGKVIELGFQPSQSTFISALMIFSQLKMSTLEQKKDAYRVYGCSECDIEMAFRVDPTSFSLSEKNIKTKMDFLVKRMGFPMAEIVRNPKLLGFSLEKRIIPRCSVIEVLISKGLIKKDVPLMSVLIPSEKRFLHNFVTNFQHCLPQLSSVYEGKVAAPELIGKS